MAFVFSVIFSSILLASMVEYLSISTKTGFAPACEIVSAVEIHEFATVITSSPSPIPNIFRTMYMASVPLATPMQCFIP